jgi:hypothetical protein
MSLISDGFGVALNVVSINPSKIVLDIPKGFSGKSYIFSLANPIKRIGTPFIIFTQNDHSTPNVTLSASNATIPANIPSNIVLTKVNMGTVNP